METSNGTAENPDVIPQNESLAKRDHLPATIYELAELAKKDGGVPVVQAVDEIINTLRKAAIKQTMPDDWTLYKTRDGRITGYLEDQGCKRITKLWRIEIFNLGPQPRSPHWVEIKDEKTEEYAIQITGDARCGWTGEELLSLTGTRYSTDDFATQKPAGIQRTMAVAAGARANLDGNATRKLTGLEGISSEELDECWNGTWKKSTMCNKGRGFGSADSRAGGGDDLSGQIDQADIPVCDHCQKKLVFRAKGNPPFWGCPDYSKHPTKRMILNHDDLVKRLADQKAKAGARDAGSEG